MTVKYDMGVEQVDSVYDLVGIYNLVQHRLFFCVRVDKQVWIIRLKKSKFLVGKEDFSVILFSSVVFTDSGFQTKISFPFAFY